VWEGLAHVPLMLRAAGIEPSRVRDRAVALIDVSPTLLSLLGVLEQPESWQGHNLFAPADGRPVFTERFSSVGITTDGRFKAFFSPGNSASGWSVFDLVRDPGEAAPIDAPRQEREFASQWLRWNAQNPKVARDEQSVPVGLCREMTKEDRKDHEEALRALGYLE
jgi:arylsulfatase A-like enzyme